MFELPLKLSYSPLELYNNIDGVSLPLATSSAIYSNESASLLPMLLPFLSEKLRDVHHYLKEYNSADTVQALKHTTLPPLPQEKIQQFFIWFRLPIHFSLGEDQQEKIELNLSLLEIINLFTEATVQSQQDLPIPHVDIPGSFVLWWLGPEYLISVLAAGGVSRQNAETFVKKHCMHLFSRQPNDFDCRIVLENAQQDNWDKVITNFEKLVGKKITEKYGEPTGGSLLSKVANSLLNYGDLKGVFGSNEEVARFLVRKMMFTRHPVPVFTKNKDFFYLLNLCEPAPFISTSQGSEKRLPVELLLQPELELNSVQHDKWRLRLDPETNRLSVVGGEAGGWHYPIDSATGCFRLTRPKDSLHDSEALIRLLLACLCGKHDLSEEDSSEYKRVASQCYHNDLQRIVKKVPQHRNSGDKSLDRLLLAMQLWEFTGEAITDDNLRTFLPKNLCKSKGLAKVLHLALYELQLPFVTVSAALKLFAWAQLQKRGENSAYSTLVCSEARWALRLEFPVDDQESAFLLLPMDLEASGKAVKVLQDSKAGRQFVCALSRQFSSNSEELKQASQNIQPIFPTPSLEDLLQDWLTTKSAALWEASLGLLPLIPEHCLIVERLINFPKLLPKVRGTEQRCSLLAKLGRWLGVSNSPAYQALHGYITSSEKVEEKYFCRLWIHFLLASQQKTVLHLAMSHTKQSLDSGLLSNENALNILAKITSRCPREAAGFYCIIDPRLQQPQARTVLWQLLQELYSLPAGVEVSAALFTLLPAVSDRILSIKSELSHKNFSLLLSFMESVASSLKPEEGYQFGIALLHSKAESKLHKRVVSVVVAAAITCLSNKQAGLSQELIQKLVKQGYTLSDAPEEMQKSLSRLLLDENSLLNAKANLPWKSLRTLRGMCTVSLEKLKEKSIFRSFANMDGLLKVKDIKQIKRELSPFIVINEWDRWIQPLLDASKLQEARLLLLWLLNDINNFNTEEANRLKQGLHSLLEKLSSSDHSTLFSLLLNPQLCQEIDDPLSFKLSLIRAKKLPYAKRVSIAQECIAEVLENTSADLANQIVDHLAVLSQDKPREVPQLQGLQKLLQLLQNFPLQIIKLCKLQTSLCGTKTALATCSKLLNNHPTTDLCEKIESILLSATPTASKSIVQPILLSLAQTWFVLGQHSKALEILSLASSFDASKELYETQLTLLSKAIENQNTTIALQVFNQLKSYTNDKKEVALAEKLCILLHQQQQWASLITVWSPYCTVLPQLVQNEEVVSLSNFVLFLFDPNSTCKLSVNARKKALTLISHSTPLSSSQWKYIIALVNNKISPDLMESLGRAFFSHQCDLSEPKVWTEMITKLGKICPKLLEELYSEPSQKMPLWENPSSWSRNHFHFYIQCLQIGLNHKISSTYSFGKSVTEVAQHVATSKNQDMINRLLANKMLWLWIAILNIEINEEKSLKAWATFTKLTTNSEEKNREPSPQISESIATCIETLLASDRDDLHVQSIGQHLSTLPRQLLPSSVWLRIVHAFQKRETDQALAKSTTFIQSLYYTSVHSEKYSVPQCQEIAQEFKKHLDLLKNNLSPTTVLLFSNALAIAAKNSLLNLSQQSEYYCKLIRFTTAHCTETGFDKKICTTILVGVCNGLEKGLPTTNEFVDAWNALLYCSYSSFKGDLEQFHFLDTEIILTMIEILQEQWEDDSLKSTSKDLVEQMLFSYLHWITDPATPLFRKRNVIDDTFDMVSDLVLHNNSKKDKTLANWQGLVNPLGEMALEVSAVQNIRSTAVPNTFFDMVGKLDLDEALFWHLVHGNLSALHSNKDYIDAVTKLSQTASYASYLAIHRLIDAQSDLFLSESLDTELREILGQTEALLKKAVAKDGTAQQNLAFLSAQNLKKLTAHMYDKQDLKLLNNLFNSLILYCHRSCQSLTLENRRNKQAAATLINTFKNLSSCSTNIDALFDLQIQCNGPSCTTSIDAFCDLQIRCVGPLARAIHPLLFETYITEAVIPALKSYSFTPQVDVRINGFTYLCRLAEALLENGPKYRASSQCHFLLYNADIPAMAGYDKNQITEFTRLLKEKSLHNFEELAAETSRTPPDGLSEQELLNFTKTKTLLFCQFAEQLALLATLWTSEQDKAVLYAHTYSWAQKAKTFLTENPEDFKVLNNFFESIPTGLSNADQFTVSPESGHSLQLDLLTLWFDQWKDVKNNEIQGMLKELLNQAIKNGWFTHNPAGMKPFIECLKSMTH